MTSNLIEAPQCLSWQFTISVNFHLPAVLPRRYVYPARCSVEFPSGVDGISGGATAGCEERHNDEREPCPDDLTLVHEMSMADTDALNGHDPATCR